MFAPAKWAASLTPAGTAPRRLAAFRWLRCGGGFSSVQVGSNQRIEGVREGAAGLHCSTGRESQVALNEQREGN